MGFFDASLLIAALNLRARKKGARRVRRVRIYPIVKRVLETLFSLLLLILLAPLFLLLTLAIRWDSPGSALFRQTRIGKDGKPFTLYKFRSMHTNIDRTSHQAFLTAFVNGEVAEGDLYKPIQINQVTRVGQLLRKTSLDELPQLLNIIKGEMSFIGPRPNVPAEVEAYRDWHRKRLDVLPGVTGLAQIRGRSSIPFDHIVKYDIEYIENESLMMDLTILLHTIPAVMGGNGAK